MTRKFIDGEWVDVVDLTQACMKVAEEGHKNFMKAYKNGERFFTMSFTNGITYKVFILGESKESDELDPKYDVRVVEVKVDTDRFVRETMYPMGYERWVRTYQLKPFKEEN